MTVPSLTSITATQFNSNATTHNVSMPASVTTGDLLLVFMAVDMDGLSTNGQITNPTGWTVVIAGNIGPSNTQRLGCFAKVSDGTEGGTTVNFATSNSQTAAAQCYRIAAGSWGGTGIGTDVVASSNATATNTTITPPALTPSFPSTNDTLWIVATGIELTVSFSTHPTGYSNDTYTTGSTGTEADNSNLATASKTSTATSETPGTFTVTGTGSRWTAATIAIQGKAAITFSMTMSGGITLAGAATIQNTVTNTSTMSGGIAFSGAAAIANTKAVTMSGGMTFGGTAQNEGTSQRDVMMSGGITFSGHGADTFVRGNKGGGNNKLTFLMTMSGGIHFGGTASIVNTVVPQVGGGITFGGTATYAFQSPPPLVFQVTMQGGIAFGGSADIAGQFSHEVTMAGGMQFGGAALVIFDDVPREAPGVHRAAAGGPPRAIPPIRTQAAPQIAVRYAQPHGPRRAR